MTGSRKDPSVNVVPQRKGRPSFRDGAVNKLANIRVGDKVTYCDATGRERVGVVSELVARGVVKVHVAGESWDHQVTARNFVRIEARTARNVISRGEREES